MNDGIAVSRKDVGPFAERAAPRKDPTTMMRTKKTKRMMVRRKKSQRSSENQTNVSSRPLLCA
jgi:hypothetical protein